MDALAQLQHYFESVRHQHAPRGDLELFFQREHQVKCRWESLELALEEQTSHESWMWTHSDQGHVGRVSWVRAHQPGADLPDLKQFPWRLTGRDSDGGYAMNTPDLTRGAANAQDLDPVPLKAQSLLDTVASLHARLDDDFPKRLWSLRAQSSVVQRAYMNSRGLVWTSSNTVQEGGCHAFDPASGRYRASQFFNLPSFDLMATDLAQHLDFPPDARLPKQFVHRGRSSMLLSPWVVELLAQLLFGFSRLGTSRQFDVLGALPAELELWDDPTLGLSVCAGPFDHEGSPTQKQCLYRGGRRLLEVSDRATALRFHQNLSTGHGYRKSLFFPFASDVTPSVHPSYLRIPPGETPLKEVFSDVSDFVYLTDISIPTDRFQDLTRPGALVTLRGYHVAQGQVLARVFGRNQPDRLLISPPPRSYGTLLDSSSVILREGAWTRSGWFPYIFLPLYTWS